MADHDPAEARSVRPTRAIPEIDGTAIASGAGGITTAVSPERAVVVPTTFVAATRTRSRKPTSDDDSCKLLDSAPATSSQTVPVASHRSQAIVVAPRNVQDPGVAVRIEPRRATPLTVGAAVLAGGGGDVGTTPLV